MGANTLKRIGAILLVAALIATVVLSALTLRSVSEAQRSQTLTGARILEMIAAELDTLSALRTNLKQPQFVENGANAQSAYLAKIRRDGVPAHAQMRHKLGSISKSNVAILTLLDLYEPFAQTEDFKREARVFRESAIAWNDRWDSLMEYFMAGGNLPASDVPFPDGLVAAVKAERKLAAN